MDILQEYISKLAPTDYFSMSSELVLVANGYDMNIGR